MKAKKLPSVLYHFTSRDHLPYILSSGVLKPTCSNLRPPDKASLQKRPDPFIPNCWTIWDKNADFKPVVWMTKEADTTATGTGLDGAACDKTEYRFTIPFQETFVSWRKFSVANNMPHQWRECIEKGRNHHNWYVHEGQLPIAGMTIHKKVNGTWVEFNPQETDIAK